MSLTAYIEELKAERDNLMGSLKYARDELKRARAVRVSPLHIGTAIHRKLDENANLKKDINVLRRWNTERANALQRQIQDTAKLKASHAHSRCQSEKKINELIAETKKEYIRGYKDGQRWTGDNYLKRQADHSYALALSRKQQIDNLVEQISYKPPTPTPPPTILPPTVEVVASKAFHARSDSDFDHYVVRINSYEVGRIWSGVWGFQRKLDRLVRRAVEQYYVAAAYTTPKQEGSKS